MASQKKKAAAKTAAKLRDLKAKKNPKGGIDWSGPGGGDDAAQPQIKRAGGTL